jgi:GlpG protein
MTQRGSPRVGRVSNHATPRACVSGAVSYAPRMSDDSSPGTPNPRDAHPRGSAVGRPVAPVTMVLIAICVAIAILSALTGGGESWTHWLYISENPFVPWLAISRKAAAMGMLPAFLPEVMHGQVWRLFTPVLMHAPILGFGILHILFNMFWLRDLGTLLEVRHRSKAFLGLVIAIAIGSNLLQYAIKGPYFVGMSGVVYGLLGYIWMQSRLNPGFGFELNSQTVTFMLIWLGAGFTGMLGPIANWAHVGGIAMGAGIGAIAAWRSGAGELLARRREFRAALAPASDSLHRCRACGRTERTNPELEFRVSGQDGEEYCAEHLPGR